jgi:molecular chaperone GrpE
MTETKDSKRKIDIEGAELETNEQVTSSQSDNKSETTEKDAQEIAENAQEEEQDALAEAQKQIDELKDKYLRAIAEFDNYKKRVIKEKAELIRNGGEKAVTAILPVLDDLERALSDKSEDPKAIKDGFLLIFNKFLKSLETLGVKKIETQDKDFDTDYHEAVAMVPGMGDDKKGKVVDCLQTGYSMNDKVIRHAKVAVGQ